MLANVVGYSLLEGKKGGEREGQVATLSFATGSFVGFHLKSKMLYVAPFMCHIFFKREASVWTQTQSALRRFRGTFGGQVPCSVALQR